MMENCEVRIDQHRTTESNEVIIKEIGLALNCNDLDENIQKFDFGAEIVKAKITPDNNDDESEVKTNMDKLAENLPIGDSSDKPEMEVVATINSAEDQDDDTGKEEEDDGGEEEEQDEEEDDDSYQTDDDNEKVNQQDKHSRRYYAHAASQDSDDDDSDSTDSDYSDLSGLSEVSGREWKPISARPINWVQKQIHSGANPRELLSQMLPTSAHQIAPGLNDMTLWRILTAWLSEPPRRQKLRYINTFEDVIQLVLKSDNIMVLTGAGVSVSCGIPDFRSSDGIYSRLAKDYPDLPDPQAMFDINYFSRDPRPFYKFAREIYPGQFKPSPCHRFIKLLEQKHKLLRNYTQNIDTLEQVAGISNVIECHGSFSTASCTKCKFKCTADAIRPDIFAQRIPVCPRCQPNVQQNIDASEPVNELELKQLVENGIMKPDIVFFGEGLPEEFHTVMANDKDKCDLLIVMGSSLKVRPVALIPSSIPAHVPQILINREQLHHLEFDVELLGDSDVIINQLCHRLGEDWKDICFDGDVLKESKDLLPLEEDSATDEGEEDAQQLLQDTDTQSVKSNASTDIALRSAGAYSDSGFESSTSSGVVVKTIEANRLMNDPLATTKSARIDLMPPDLLDEHMDSVDVCGNPGFHPFTDRLGRSAASAAEYAETYRHLSIDSSKDSGIQCDSSNSALASSSAAAAVAASALLPPISNFGDSGGTNEPGRNTPAASSSTAATPNAAAAADIKNLDKQTAEINSKRGGADKHQSAADRLREGTYYCHESSSSYVFPGAQVSWCGDSEAEEDIEEDDNDFIDDEGDTNAGPLSPLMPPSVEAEIVSEIVTSTRAASAFSKTCSKRHSSDDLEAVAAATSSTTHTSNTEAHNQPEPVCKQPPVKKRRDLETEDDAFRSTTCKSTTSNSNSRPSSPYTGHPSSSSDRSSLHSTKASVSTAQL